MIRKRRVQNASSGGDGNSVGSDEKMSEKTPNGGSQPVRWSARAFGHSLFEEVSIQSVVVMRVFWGLVMAMEISSFMRDEYVKAYTLLDDPSFLFHYWGFGWVPRLSMDGWRVLLQVLWVAAICVSLGFLYRLAAVTFFLGFTFLFLQDMTFYLNHFYMVIVFLLVLCFVPANRAYSVDALLGLAGTRKSSPRAATIPFWAPWLMCFLVSNVYVHAGLAKVNEDWLRGEPLMHWVPARAALYPRFAALLEWPGTALAMSWSGLLFDTFVPFAFYYRPTRPLALMASLFFHCTNKLLFNIGIFPLVMVVLTSLYYEVNWPERLLALLTGRPVPAAAPQVPRPARPNAPFTWRQTLTLSLIGLFCAHQVLVPLRHHLYPGDVTWNEEGHRYSWRMKLRDKAGMAKFYIVDHVKNQTNEVEYDYFLPWRQVVKMAGRPEMIHLFADHVGNLFESKFGYRPAVHAIVIGSVNYRTPQFMVDPRVDLAAIEPWSWPNDWVVQLLPRGTTKHKFIPETAYPTDDLSKDRLFLMYGHMNLDDFLAEFEKIDRQAEQAGVGQ